MFSCVNSIGLNGIDGYLVKVETSISPGLTGCEIVGLPDTSVREAKERVLSAISNNGFDLPYGRITINLAPATTKKEGAVFDLPIAISLLIAMQVLTPQDIDSYAFLGELSLDGSINNINGILPMTIFASKSNIKNLIVPSANALEAGIVKNINIFHASSLADVLSHICEKNSLPKAVTDTSSLFTSEQTYSIDFSDIKGQLTAKRVCEIAAAGNHNLLLIGTPGSGKTMISKRIPSILPDLTFEEALEITKIYSISGLLSRNTSLITTRPFRNPHHTISNASLIGGGKYPHPGEVSLAHNGVLFLDELPEFNKSALEVLRQPLEDHTACISRVNGSYTFPSNFMFVASMNPCPCGYYGSDKKQCKCSPIKIRSYLNKISGPLLDRIDLHLEVPCVKYEDLNNSIPSESSKSIKERVNNARKIQLLRYKKLKIYSNSELTPSLLSKYCCLDNNVQLLLKNAFDKLGLSARAYSSILKVSRTIADLENSEKITSAHVAEAIQYRNLDRKYFEN